MMSDDLYCLPESSVILPVECRQRGMADAALEEINSSTLSVEELGRTNEYLARAIEKCKERILYVTSRCDVAENAIIVAQSERENYREQMELNSISLAECRKELEKLSGELTQTRAVSHDQKPGDGVVSMKCDTKDQRLPQDDSADNDADDVS